MSVIQFMTTELLFYFFTFRVNVCTAKIYFTVAVKQLTKQHEFYYFINLHSVNTMSGTFILIITLQNMCSEECRPPPTRYSESFVRLFYYIYLKWRLNPDFKLHEVPTIRIHNNMHINNDNNKITAHLLLLVSRCYGICRHIIYVEASRF